MNREYSTSLDYQIDGISIVSARINSNAEEIVIHDASNGIVRWGGIAIYEDMFRNFTTCELTLEDVDGFYLNRLRSEETLVITFKTPDFKGKKFEKRRHEFYIYKIDPIVFQDRPAKAFYTIRGISFEYFSNALTTFSKSYKGKTEKIVAEIYNDSLKIKDTKVMQKKLKVGRSTKNEMKFVFPYTNPVDAINHLASVSIDESNPEICNYVFFENTDGFNFMSITEMIENPRKIHKYTTTKVIKDKITDFEKNFDKTITVVPKRTGDKIIDTLDGVYGEFFSEYDILYKSYKPYISIEPDRPPGHGKRYLDSFKKTRHLNEFPLLSSDNKLFQHPLGKNRVCFTNEALHSEKINLANGEKEWKLYATHEGEYSFQRRSMMQQINTFTVEMTVPGNSDVTVGDIIIYDGSIYNTVEKDKYISGRYLVTAINHFISRDGYKSIITMSRDSIMSDGSEQDAKATGGL